MSDRRVDLAEIALPEFGLPGVEPVIPAATYEARIAAARQRAAEAGYDVLLVYADREHFANLAYLTGFDPRFEEALLILAPGRAPVLLAGNEDVTYTAIGPLRLDVVLYQTFSLLGQPRSTSAPLSTILRDAGLGGSGSARVGIAGWKYFISSEAEEPDLWSEAPAYLVDTLRGLGCAVRNAGRLFMEPERGLRAVSDVDQLASFEFASTHGSQSLRTLLFNVRPGMTEFEAFQLMAPIGLPFSCHPLVFSGERAALGLPSPSGRVLEGRGPRLCLAGLLGQQQRAAGSWRRVRRDCPPRSRTTSISWSRRTSPPWSSGTSRWASACRAAPCSTSSTDAWATPSSAWASIRAI